MAFLRPSGEDQSGGNPENLVFHANIAAMTRKKLPIGIQTFAKIREADYYYVDKTGIAVDLVEGAYFSDRGRLFQRDRGRRFKLIVDAQGCAQARK